MRSTAGHDAVNSQASPVLNKCREFESAPQRSRRIAGDIFVETDVSPVKCESFAWLVQCRPDD
jgi:hypothetical protein